jgi:hypothetical protein
VFHRHADEKIAKQTTYFAGWRQNGAITLPMLIILT